MIALMQETHFQYTKIPSCKSRYYTTWHHNPHPTRKAGGISVVIHKQLPHQLISTEKDTERQYLLLKNQISNEILTIANICFTNQDQKRFGVRMLGVW
ncbi:hypothetical protein GDO78_015123 [Eleutherodactylus coqui]|uniref:Uncharacterized protein n=1 Tax=Eleutherodactylus coqui TaxID=57060 RepID=A0A8J6BF37_ELECQ|nr:hypothetical protein GDO78_015123 [Eleutherodactylus coqui]